jgi:hypothetical protein
MFASAAMYLSTRAIVRNPRWDRRNPQGIIALAREMERCLARVRHLLRFGKGNHGARSRSSFLPRIDYLR